MCLSSIEKKDISANDLEEIDGYQHTWSGNPTQNITDRFAAFDKLSQCP